METQEEKIPGRPRERFPALLERADYPALDEAWMEEVANSDPRAPRRRPRGAAAFFAHRSLPRRVLKETSVRVPPEDDPDIRYRNIGQSAFRLVPRRKRRFNGTLLK